MVHLEHLAHSAGEEDEHGGPPDDPNGCIIALLVAATIIGGGLMVGLQFWKQSLDDEAEKKKKDGAALSGPIDLAALQHSVSILVMLDGKQVAIDRVNKADLSRIEGITLLDKSGHLLANLDKAGLSQLHTLSPEALREIAGLRTLEEAKTHPEIIRLQHYVSANQSPDLQRYAGQLASTPFAPQLTVSNVHLGDERVTDGATKARS